MNTPETRFGPGAADPEAPSPLIPRTTLRLEGGLPRHPQAHGRRLAAALDALGIETSWLAPALEEAWAWAGSRGAGPEPMALRLWVEPGRRCLGARVEPLPPTPSPYRLVPLEPPCADRRGPPPAPHKGRLGRWGGEARERARARGAEDALLLWPDGAVAETAIAALGLEEGGRLRLPAPEGRVRSLAEFLDLPGWADERNWEVAVSPFSFQEARRGRLWCFNALRGLWPAETL